MRPLVPIVCGTLLGLSLLSSPALAGGLKPDDAQAKRDAITVDLSDDPKLAAVELQAAAEELGDPVLFLAAADKLRFEAEATRELELAERALPLAMTARDIALYLGNDGNDKRSEWHPVTKAQAIELSGEANRTIAAIERLIEEIEQERADAAAAAEAARLAALEDDDRQRREMKPGTGMIAGGSAALVVGLGGVAMIGTGVAMGQARQREAEALDLPNQLDQLAELDRQGAQANTIAYVGGAVAGVGIIAGATLIALGVRKRKRAGQAGLESEQARVHVGGYFDRQGGGLSIQGRF